MNKIQLDNLVAALSSAWLPETSYSPDEWSLANPARGQCVVSALIVQDYLGGELGRYNVLHDGAAETHYFNILAHGVILDTTIGQYGGRGSFEGGAIDLKGHKSVRDKLLADTGTKARYEILRQRVGVVL